MTVPLVMISYPLTESITFISIKKMIWLFRLINMRLHRDIWEPQGTPVVDKDLIMKVFTPADEKNPSTIKNLKNL